MKEKLCPICSKIIRSDADIHEYCTLCGMDISEYSSVPNYKNKDGNILYFCCARCLLIYETEIVRDDYANQF